MMINHRITSSPSMKDMMVNEAHDDDNTFAVIRALGMCRKED